MRIDKNHAKLAADLRVRIQTCAMASIGPKDVDFLSSPRPNLLQQIAAIEPVAAGTHVMLDVHDFKSTQRLAVGETRGRLVTALWPAELKRQAKYLYGLRLATPMIKVAMARGWTAEPSPHLAFRYSVASQRLYMRPAVGAEEYARRWEDGDLTRVGQHSRSDVKTTLWPWLKSRGYATDADDRVLDEWLSRYLGRRPALMRPGLSLKRSWATEDLRTARGTAATAAAIRDDVNAILAAAGEPPLPATQRASGRKGS